jgi:RES domain-containing protein
MRVWRLCRRAHAAFDGEGARLYGGRWSLRGTPVVYTSGDAALAVLEYFVHLELEDAPPDLVLIPADIPDSLGIEEVRAEDSPRNWRASPSPEALARIGTAWVASRRSAALAVPSVVVPVGSNYLLNPAHPEFGKIVVGKAQKFRFDPRMGSRREG